MAILFALHTYQTFFVFVKPHSAFMTPERRVLGEWRARTPCLLAMPAEAYPPPSVAQPTVPTGTGQLLCRWWPPALHWVFILPQISRDGVMKVPGQGSDPVLDMRVCHAGSWDLPASAFGVYSR